MFVLMPVIAALHIPGTDSTQAAVLAVLVAVLAALAVLQMLVLIQRYRMVKDIIRWIRIRRTGEPARQPIVLAHAQLERLVREIQALAVVSETERRELLVQSSYLQTLLACLNDPVIILDDAGNPVLSNQRAIELLTTPSDPETQRSVRDFCGREPVMEIISAAARAAGPMARQIRLNVLGRPRILQITASPIKPGPQSGGVLLLLQDQTELLQNVQIKADFAANASHELRTPLASIRAAVETINEAGFEDRVTLKRCLDIVGGHVMRLQLLVQDLLDLSRTEDPRAVVRHEPIKLEELRDLILGMFKNNAIEKHLELRFDIAPDARIILGDERLVLLILKNLIDNSLKFTTAGFILVRSRHELRNIRPTDAENGPDLTSPPSEEVTILEVEDTGCGIPPEDIHRVFERFYTVNRSRGGADRGTGLGLAIVKHAMAAMGGVVELQSQSGLGTIVRCIWPPSRAAIPARRTTAEPAPAASAG